MTGIPRLKLIIIKYAVGKYCIITKVKQKIVTKYETE